jgi:serine/threonine protein kinase
MLPTQIDDYRIVRELGKGGMGTVYEAEEITLSRRVAIKVVRPEYARDPEVEMRFVNEARALARIEHPSIVRIYKFGVLADGTSYLAMEFLDGESLAQRWRQAGRPTDPFQALHLMQQIADVLAMLHSHGVVHRDLKPENVMIVSERTASGPALERAKLVDFGLAKLIRLSGQHTASALIMGTPAYMSPEQCRGAGQVDAKTDCYALGVMLYELIAHRLPFDSPWVGDLIGMHLHFEPQPLEQHVPTVDPRLASLIRVLLNKDKDRRPAMAEVAKYLHHLLTQGQSSSAETLPSLNPPIDEVALGLAATHSERPAFVSTLSPVIAPQRPQTPPTRPAAVPAISPKVGGRGHRRLLLGAALIAALLMAGFLLASRHQTGPSATPEIARPSSPAPARQPSAEPAQSTKPPIPDVPSRGGVLRSRRRHFVPAKSQPEPDWQPQPLTEPATPPHTDFRPVR